MITRPAPDGEVPSPLLGNAILATLPPADLASISDHVRVLSLTRGQTTNQGDQLLRHVDFPLDAMVSIMATFATGTTCEVAFVGREGFVEADAALAAGTISRTTICQIPGRVARIRADIFAEKLGELPSFDRLIRRSLRSRLYITEQIAACNLRHTVTERLARWLLTTADQMGSNRVSLTQETFAVMLGVRRAGVSEAAAALQRLGAVKVERAAISIVDREALRVAGCECYEAMRSVLSTSLTVDRD